jgi:LemA protein
MNVVAIALLILAGLGLVLVAVTIVTYNGLVTSRNGFKNAFSQIDVQLQRRYDLIPNLVETAKGYLKHERETLEAVIAARNQAMGAVKGAASNPGASKEMLNLNAAEGVLGGALGRLMAVVEQYPDLKAQETMKQLMEELSSTENKVGFARQAYNDAVLAYNNRREVFPTVVIAGMFNFAAATYFEVTDEGVKVAPKVSFT